MEIELVAKETPSQVLKLPIDLDGTIQSYHLIRLGKLMGWGWDGKKIANGEGLQIAKGLAKALFALDASLIELNPLVETEEGKILALDAKVTIDDNALFRQKALLNAFDATQLPEREIKAREADLSYISLKGNIGCMVNGAGLAMATMDIIQLAGGHPANFLDVGGGANAEKVAMGFKIILSDPEVKVVLVNIFGGIMNCATLAFGIIQASTGMDIKVPIVLRMEGTNVEEGKRLLNESNLNITIAKDLEDAARIAVSKGT